MNGPRLPAEMNAIDPAEPGGPEVLALGPAAGAAAGRGRGADRGRRRRRQPAGRAPAPRPLSAAAGRALDPRARGRRADRRAGRRGAGRTGRPAASARWSPAAAMPNMRSRRPASACRCPAALTMIEAAAMPETLFTVWTNLFERGLRRRGRDRARPWRHQRHRHDGDRARPICSASGSSSPAAATRNAAAREALGARHAINYQTQDFVEEVKRLTGGAGVHIVLDMVGGDYLPRNLDCLAEEGRHVSIAVQRGADRRGQHRQGDAAPADPHRLDAAAALGRVQVAGRRRARAQRSGRCRGRAS